MNPQQQNQNPQYNKDQKDQPDVKAGSRNPNQPGSPDPKQAASPRPQDDDMDDRNGKSQKEREEADKGWKSPAAK